MTWFFFFNILLTLEKDLKSSLIYWFPVVNNIVSSQFFKTIRFCTSTARISSCLSEELLESFDEFLFSFWTSSLIFSQSIFSAISILALFKDGMIKSGNLISND